eukprot:GEMP01037819.1.p1 GENE.GEMP01037819.1~~GEMP01037819.1.p1  ORF type:complete len:185 (+),score=33.45 GEMP01037819.1:191-745(+)
MDVPADMLEAHDEGYFAAAGGIAFSRHEPPAPPVDCFAFAQTESPRASQIIVDCGVTAGSISNEAAELMALRQLTEEFRKEKEQLKIERDELRVQLATAVENHKALTNKLERERKRLSEQGSTLGTNGGVLRTENEFGAMRDELLTLRKVEAHLRQERSVTNLAFLGIFLACLSLGPVLFLSRR